jgi:hypothetical protein
MARGRGVIAGHEAGFGNTAVRPKDALSGAGGAGAAGGRAARGAAAEGRRVVVNWKGDWTAPIGRKASTNVMPALESIQNQETLALNGVPPELSFEVRRQVSSVLQTCTKVVFKVFVPSIVSQFALLRSSSSSWEVVATRSTAASEQTRMACYRTATDSHAEKSCSGAGGAGAAAGRVVSGAAARAEGRRGSTAAREQTCVM